VSKAAEKSKAIIPTTLPWPKAAAHAAEAQAMAVPVDLPLLNPCCSSGRCPPSSRAVLPDGQFAGQILVVLANFKPSWLKNYVNRPDFI
jgi:hypothetical protein